MKKIGIYIHVPFCKSKCPYCDFYSISTDTQSMDKYTDELTKKFVKYKKELADNNITVDTVYFGGGTPSTLGTERLCYILDSLSNNFAIDDNAEITMEMNPTSADIVDFTALKSNGINRLSIGMQSANPDEMRLLGRHHTANDVEHTVKRAEKAGISNISLDLIIGVPSQTKNSLKQSMDFCKVLGAKHISAYILKIEKGTPFYQMKNNLNLLSDDEQADQYLYVCEYLEKLGYKQYEISNFSLSGYESRHNNKYWQCREYLGFGPSAHSFYNGKRFYYKRNFEDFYNDIIIEDGTGGTKEEFIMLNLRLKRGLILNEYKRKYGEELPKNLINKAKKFEKIGLLNINEEKISLTRKGYLLSNAIICELI